jgi:hypothetical protein
VVECEICYGGAGGDGGVRNGQGKILREVSHRERTGAECIPEYTKRETRGKDEDQRLYLKRRAHAPGRERVVKSEPKSEVESELLREDLTKQKLQYEGFPCGHPP